MPTFENKQASWQSARIGHLCKICRAMPVRMHRNPTATIGPA